MKTVLVIFSLVSFLHCTGVRAEYDVSVGRCYKCNKTCQVPPEEESCYMPELVKYKCMYEKYRSDGKTVEIRGCARPELFEDSCNQMNQAGGICYLCDKDLCNRSSAEMYSFSFIMIFSLFVFISRFL